MYINQELWPAVIDIELYLLVVLFSNRYQPFFVLFALSIEVLAKIADALEVSVDYLIGKTNLQLDKQAIKRLEDISKLPEENKTFVLNLIDMALRDFKVKGARFLKIQKPPAFANGFSLFYLLVCKPS